MHTTVAGKRSALAACLLLAAALVSGAACRQRPASPPAPRPILTVDLGDIDDSTPETTADAVATAIVAGRQDLVWDLLSPEHQTEFAAGLVSTRDAMRRNPGNEKLGTQFKVTVEEFMTLPAREIWIRSQAGNEAVLRDARMAQVFRDPQTPTDVNVDVEARTGLRWRWTMRPNADGRWRVFRFGFMRQELEQGAGPGPGPGKQDTK